MENSSFSPANLSLIQQRQNVALNQPVAPISQENNQTKPNGKKLLAFGAAALGVAGIAAVAIMTNKSHKIKNYAQEIFQKSDEIITKGEEIKTKGQEYLEKGKQAIEEVLGLAKKGQENDYADILDETGKVSAKFEVEEVDGQKVLKSISEFDSDGVEIRTSSFKYNLLNNINIKNENRTDCLIVSHNALCKYDILSQYNIGCEELADGGAKAQESFVYFVDGTLSRHVKGYEELADDGTKIQEGFEYFVDGTLSRHVKGYEELADGGPCFACFVDETLSFYDRGSKELGDGSTKVQEEFKYFVDGSLRRHGKGLEELANGSTKAQEVFDIHYDDNDNRASAKLYLNYSKTYKYDKDGNYTGKEN